MEGLLQSEFSVAGSFGSGLHYPDRGVDRLTGLPFIFFPTNCDFFFKLNNREIFPLDFGKILDDRVFSIVSQSVKVWHMFETFEI